MADPQLSFWQRHFTKPSNKDSEKTAATNHRRLSFFSRGFIIAAIAMLLILLGVVAAAVAVTLDCRPRTSGSSNISPIRAALDDNFPDPAIWYYDGTYYAFATNNAAGILKRPHNASSYEYGVSNVQMAISKDFKNWTLLGASEDPLPQIGAWVTPGLTKAPPRIPKSGVWAPEILQRKTDNKFVMYYSANRKNATAGPGHPPPHCIGAAVSKTDSPAGPYEPLENTLACHIDQGGAIDPAGFVDKDGTQYVLYKIDGNNIGHGGVCGNTKAPIMPTPLMLQKMATDGVTATGAPIQILDRIKGDGPLIEAPALVRSTEGIYFLFFSSGCTRAPSYNIKYATSKNISGPYIRAAHPLLQTGDYGLLAPGSVSVHEDGKGVYNMAFHARVIAPQGRIRALFTTQLAFKGRSVSLVSGEEKKAS
ncbi:hypothetical protein LTR62_002519 [Meristemomyces frigidus]|uniref:Arabinanase/levansucrase/invertase n=1 Tax=Meristemomyces frigidus TaxID=1508187 RepID=A0AAN7TGN7_9PEZI|nr:hypothetical protein LTR62_002519 [Meristemomyces frigidus]